MKKILLIGANSFVGKRLAEHLQEKYEVIVTYHLNKNPQLSQQEKLDITDKVRVEEILEKIKPDCVILAAAISSTDASEEIMREVNVKGVYNLVSSLKNQNTGSKIVFFSTEQVFDGKKRIYTEKDLPGPINSYGKSKLEAEKIVQSYKDHLILRCSVIIGSKKPDDHDNFLTNFLNSKKKLTIFNNVYRTTLFADDIPLIIEQLIEKDCCGIINLSNSQLLSYAQMVDKIEKEFNIRKEYELVKCEIRTIPLNLGLDNRLLRSTIDFDVTGFDDMLRKIKKQTGDVA